MEAWAALLALRTAESATATGASISGSRVAGELAQRRGRAARGPGGTEPSCHHDQTSSVA